MAQPRPMRRLRIPRPLLIVMVPVLVLVTINFGAQIYARVSAIPAQRALAAFDREQLFYPSAVVLAQGRNGAEWNLSGRAHPSATYLLGSNAAVKDIFAFYEREMAARGWVRSATDVIIGTAEVNGIAYRNGDLALQIVVLRPDDDRNSSLVRPYVAPYRLTIVDKPLAR